MTGFLARGTAPAGPPRLHQWSAPPGRNHGAAARDQPIPRILIIDDHPATLVDYAGVLQRAGFTVTVASGGREGLTLLQRTPVHLVLADLCLPDISGLDVLREVRTSPPAISLIIITGFGTDETEVEAMELGAAAYQEKPLAPADLVRLVERGLMWTPPDRPALPASDARDQDAVVVGPAARRWAEIVIAMARFNDDVRTTYGWGRKIGKSRGALKRWCADANVSAKESLDFARLLRAVIRHEGRVWDLYNVLDIVDPRTLNRLLGRAGLPPATAHRAPDVVTFLEIQQLVRSSVLLTALRERLNSLPHREKPI